MSKDFSLSGIPLFSECCFSRFPVSLLVLLSSLSLYLVLAPGVEISVSVQVEIFVNLVENTGPVIVIG